MSKKKKEYKKQNSANKFMDLFISQINKKRNIIKERKLEKFKNILEKSKKKKCFGSCATLFKETFVRWFF